MKNTSLHNRLFTLAVVAGAIFGAVNVAQAVPVVGQYQEDARCDTLPNQALADELGQVTFFPLNEAVEVATQATSQNVCAQPDGLANDWNVQIRNLTGVAWKDLFLVVDAGATLGNSDGMIRDAVGAPTIFADAMRIDSLGINNNLFFESGPVNNIFDVGEVWRFNVSNFNNATAAGGFQPPIFVTPGKFAGSSPLGTTNGNASILATPVPEPATASMLLGAAAALLLRRPGRNRG